MKNKIRCSGTQCVACFTGGINGNFRNWEKILKMSYKTDYKIERFEKWFQEYFKRI